MLLANMSIADDGKKKKASFVLLGGSISNSELEIVADKMKKSL